MGLTSSEIEKIEWQTWDLLADTYEGKIIIPPIDINLVVAKSNLILSFGVFKDINIDGAYDKSNRVIYVAKGQRYERQVFTVAHELGHYYLHPDKASETFYRGQSPEVLSPEVQQEEQEANWFAASLLMPKPLVQAIWPLLGNNTAELAKRFSVSSSAASYRLHNLGYVR